MKMYKLFLEERFLLWDVCSIQLQVSCGNGGEELLSLAEAYWFAWFTWTRNLATNLDVLDSKLGKLFSIENNKLRIQLVGKATYLSMWICWCRKKFYGMSWTHAQMFGNVYTVSQFLLGRWIRCMLIYSKAIGKICSWNQNMALFKGYEEGIKIMTIQINKVCCKLDIVGINDIRDCIGYNCFWGPYNNLLISQDLDMGIPDFWYREALNWDKYT